MSRNSILYYEAGQDAAAMQALTDSGDHKAYDSTAELWSGYPGFAPVIRVNAVLSGGIISPAVSETADAIDVTAVSCYLNGVDKTGTSKIAADTDVALTRGANAYMISSVVVTAAGAIDIIEGTSSASALSETRGAAGGPPYIPVDAIEIGQIRTTSASSAVITADEIFQVPGVHREILPSYDIRYARVADRIIGVAGIDFPAALPTIHTGDTTRAVYASWYEPLFAELVGARNFDPPRISGSVSSEQFYFLTRGSVSESLGTGSFEYLSPDGISDDFLGRRKSLLWYKFKEDRFRDPYMIVQAYSYDTGAFPADGNLTLTVNLVSEAEAERVIA